MSAKKILVTAHAGCMNTECDSLDSVLAGISAGADIVEVDIRFIDSKVPVLSHDTFEHGQPECLVRLEEVLDIVQDYPNITLNLDMKEIEGIIYLVQLLHKKGMIERVFFTGLEPEFAAVVQRECIDIPYLVNYNPEFLRISDMDYLQGLVDMVKDLDAIGINLYYCFVTHQLVEAFHNANKKVYVWTIDDEEDIRRMIQLGVDSITSNRVDLLVQTLKEADLY